MPPQAGCRFVSSSLIYLIQRVEPSAPQQVSDRVGFGLRQHTLDTSLREYLCPDGIQDF
jgi:hypothetical protein